MSTFRVFVVVSCILFGIIFLLALNKKQKVDKGSKGKDCEQVVTQQVDLSTLNPLKEKSLQGKPSLPIQTPQPSHPQPVQDVLSDSVSIEHDQQQEAIASLFEKGSTCPIVETVTYKSRVPWKPHRPAWLIDYAHHFRTSLPFIYRSLTGEENGVPKTICDGAQFNVFRNDVDFRFHLVVSLHSRVLRLYYIIPGEHRVVFLKSYPVCVGRKDSSKTSGCLTPLGTYQLGERVGVFSPGVCGMHKGKKVELIQVFGPYWIPFDKEIRGCSEPAKGFGVHGLPSIPKNDKSYEEDDSSLGQFESDGCIRVRWRDIRELFSIVSTRKTFVEIVPSFQQSRIFQGEV